MTFHEVGVTHRQKIQLIGLDCLLTIVYRVTIKIWQLRDEIKVVFDPLDKILFVNLMLEVNFLKL